jgi:hypothetical protein
MVPMALSFSDSLGMRQEPTTKTPRQVAGSHNKFYSTNLLTSFMISNYATMRFEPESLHGANAGLNVARTLMEKVKTEFPWISYGDLWTLAGVAAIQVTIFPYWSSV